jgi:hypothetical protein
MTGGNSANECSGSSTPRSSPSSSLTSLWRPWSSTRRRCSVNLFKDTDATGSVSRNTHLPGVRSLATVRGPCPNIEELRADIMTVSVHGNALASAIAQSASVAARSASTIALEAAETIPQLVKNICDCRTKKENAKGQTKALRGMLQEFATNEADMTCMMPS